MDNKTAAKNAARVVLHIWSAFAIFAVGSAISIGILSNMDLFQILLVVSRIIVEIMTEPFGVIATILIFSITFFHNKYLDEQINMKLYYYFTLALLWLIILSALLTTREYYMGA